MLVLVLVLVEVDVDVLPNVIVPLNPVSAEVLVTIEPDAFKLLAVMASIICTSVTLAPLMKISSFSLLISYKPVSYTHLTLPTTIAV